MCVSMIYKTLVKVFSKCLIRVVLPGDLFQIQEHMAFIRSRAPRLLRISMLQSNPICRRPDCTYLSPLPAGFITASKRVGNAIAFDFPEIASPDPEAHLSLTNGICSSEGQVNSIRPLQTKVPVQVLSSGSRTRIVLTPNWPQLLWMTTVYRSSRRVMRWA